MPSVGPPPILIMPLIGTMLLAAPAGTWLQKLSGVVLEGLSLGTLNLDAYAPATGYISFFTVGEDECRAWSIPRQTPAQLAASEIHSDIARGFIRAEVVSYDALIGRGSMAACRDHGEVRLEGKEYVVLDGDIINFRHAT